mmetsp:Transcript_31821/g.84992  ORF Transcript_31821/g.84992 Transcript_31821/m.84992 type:complete len:101 (+) Transcript_31821:753-1055(+)
MGAYADGAFGLCKQCSKIPIHHEVSEQPPPVAPLMQPISFERRCCRLPAPHNATTTKHRKSRRQRDVATDTLVDASGSLRAEAMMHFYATPWYVKCQRSN